jgi:hypothetical protein
MESLAPRRVESGDMRNTAGEVGAKVFMPKVVLALGAVSDADEEKGLEGVVIIAADVQAVVDDHPGNALPRAAPHDAGLAGLDDEALFQRDRGDMGWEAREGSRKIRPAGEDEVVGIPRVIRA